MGETVLLGFFECIMYLYVLENSSTLGERSGNVM
jgi:hypothetical protein